MQNSYCDHRNFDSGDRLHVSEIDHHSATIETCNSIIITNHFHVSRNDKGRLVVLLKRKEG
jgi:hypothetical protein